MIKCNKCSTKLEQKTNNGMCKLCTKDYNSQYYKANKEKMLAQQKEYYSSNKETISAKQSEYARKNPDVNKRASKKYRQTEKGKLIYNAKTRNYRAKKRNAEGHHTGKEFAEVILKQNHCCFWCKFPFEKLEADHYIPLAKGGSNWISNIVASCRACNAMKQDLMPNEFLTYLNALPKPVNHIE